LKLSLAGSRHKNEQSWNCVKLLKRPASTSLRRTVGDPGFVFENARTEQNKSTLAAELREFLRAYARIQRSSHIAGQRQARGEDRELPGWRSDSEGPGPGKVISFEGKPVQIMHNGLRVVAGGYYGDWMTRIIERLHGHHEPQEEAVFHEILKLLPPDATMLELGGFWSYYFTRSGSNRSTATEDNLMWLSRIPII
jgi:hypothetical protein